MSTLIGCTLRSTIPAVESHRVNVVQLPVEVLMRILSFVCVRRVGILAILPFPRWNLNDDTGLSWIVTFVDCQKRSAVIQQCSAAYVSRIPETVLPDTPDFVLDIIKILTLTCWSYQSTPPITFVPGFDRFGMPTIDATRETRRSGGISWSLVIKWYDDLTRRKHAMQIIDVIGDTVCIKHKPLVEIFVRAFMADRYSPIADML